MIKKFFPYGTHMYRESSRPIAELKKDMKIIKNLGFNMVKIQESWAIDEQREGEINLSKIEELIVEAENLDLMIYFGVTMEQAPAWLWKKYPDCRLVYNTGEVHNDPTQYLHPADGKPGPCWDHPEAREAAERFITALVKKLSHYKNIIAWNIFQEIDFYPVYPHTLSFCYCPHTLNQFRLWLKEKCATLEVLNKRWRTGYGDWDEVEPPRNFAAVPSWIDWQYFMEDIYLAKVLKWKKELFKKNDPYQRPVFAHLHSFRHLGQGAEWRWAKELDFFGASCYPAWRAFGGYFVNRPQAGKPVSKEKTLKAEMWNGISLHFDYTRSACKGKEFWAAEFQGGPISIFLHKGRIPSPEDIQRWVLTALSTGITGLSFWNHRAEIFWLEAYGFGLLDSEGDSSPRAEEAGRIGKAINKYPELFRKGKLPQPEVAIIINENLYHFARATPDAESHLSRSIQGIYKMLWGNGIWVDFVEASEIKDDKLKDYKVTILPFPLAISDELMNKLKDYVADDGVLISEACPGRYDEYSFARPGEISNVAEDLFGVEHKGLTLCHEPGEPHWTPAEWSYGEIIPATRFSGTGTFKGHSVLANLYVETFLMKGSTPMLLNGEETTGVVNAYGQGKAYLIGTFLGHSATYEDTATEDFLLKLLADVGVKAGRCGKLLRRRRILNNQEAWFLINPTKETVSERIDFKSFSKIEDLLKGSVNKNKSVEVPGFSVRVFILQK